MSTRITILWRVLNSFLLLIHSWVLLMFLLQGRCPIKNVNAATGSTLSYIFCIPVSQHHRWLTLSCLQYLLLRLLKRCLPGEYLTSFSICHSLHLSLIPHKTHGSAYSWQQPLPTFVSADSLHGLHSNHRSLGTLCFLQATVPLPDTESFWVSFSHVCWSSSFLCAFLNCFPPVPVLHISGSVLVNQRVWYHQPQIWILLLWYSLLL